MVTHMWHTVCFACGASPLCLCWVSPSPCPPPPLNIWPDPGLAEGPLVFHSPCPGAEEGRPGRAAHCLGRDHPGTVGPGQSPGWSVELSHQAWEPGGGALGTTPVGWCSVFSHTPCRALPSAQTFSRADAGVKPTLVSTLDVSPLVSNPLGHQPGRGPKPGPLPSRPWSPSKVILCPKGLALRFLPLGRCVELLLELGQSSRWGAPRGPRPRVSPRTACSRVCPTRSDASGPCTGRLGNPVRPSVHGGRDAPVWERPPGRNSPRFTCAGLGLQVSRPCEGDERTSQGGELTGRAGGRGESRGESRSERVSPSP